MQHYLFVSIFGLQSLYVIIKEEKRVLSIIDNTSKENLEDFMEILDSLKEKKLIMLFKEFEVSATEEELRKEFNILMSVVY